MLEDLRIRMEKDHFYAVEVMKQSQENTLIM